LKPKATSRSRVSAEIRSLPDAQDLPDDFGLVGRRQMMRAEAAFLVAVLVRVQKASWRFV
jgi:hypothetical protein